MEPTRRADWEAALDKLELSVEHAESLLRGEDVASGGPWTSPALQGPPPHDLLARAQKLLLRQQEAASATAAVMDRTRRELEQPRRVNDHRSRVSAPVYLDVEA
jgi:hypothetical protein